MIDLPPREQTQFALMCAVSEPEHSECVSDVVPAVRSGEEARRRSPQTRLIHPHGHGYGTDDDIRPDVLKTQAGGKSKRECTKILTELQ